MERGRGAPPQECLVADVAHHVGVLYHLKGPVTHLQRLGRYVRVGIMLDTHYCLDEEACESYSVDGKQYLHKRYIEGGRCDVRGGPGNSDSVVSGSLA